MWYYACIKNTIYFFWPQKKKCNLALQQKLIKKQYVVEFLMCVARKWKSSCSIEDEKGSIWNLKQPKMCSDFFDRTSHFFRLVLLKELFVCLLQTPSRVEIPTSIALGCGEKNETSDYILTPLTLGQKFGWPEHKGWIWTKTKKVYHTFNNL